MALIIDIDRAATPWHRPVIDYGAFFAGNFLPDQSGKCGCLLAIEIGFQAVTHGFVNQHSRPTWAEYNFHFAGGCFACIELKNGLPRRFFSEVLRRFVAEEKVQRHTSTTA